MGFKCVKKKMIIAFAMLLSGFLIASINVNAESICNAAEFGETGSQDNFILNCSTTSDGLCPEDYGEWGFCLINQNTAKACSTPDPDCGIVPQVYFVNFPAVSNSGDKLKLIVHATVDRKDDKIVLLRNINPGGVPNYQVVGNQNCNVINPNDAANWYCEITFDGGVAGASPLLITPSTGGSYYDYKAYLLRDATKSVEAIGITTPIVKIKNPADGSQIIGMQNIEVEASSRVGITQIDYYAEQETGAGSYTKVNVENNAGNCLACTTDTCNKFASSTISNLQTVNDVKVFDTTKCGNENFRIIAVAKDIKNSGSASVTALISNAVPGCPGCSFASKILNLAVARIRVWV